MKLVEDYRRLIESDQRFIAARDIVKANSEGNAWLIGGAVYRNLNFLLYEQIEQSPDVKNFFDFDFIVEKPKIELVAPTGWAVKKNKYGNPKFVHRDFSFDFVSLETIDSIIRRNLEPTIKNFLTGTPLTVQSIFYDLERQELEGKTGMNAVLTRTVGVNCLSQLIVYAKRKESTPREIIETKARSLGFDPVYDGL